MGLAKTLIKTNRGNGTCASLWPLGITCALWSLFSLSSLPLSIIFVSSSASCFLRFSLLSSSSSSLKNSRWLTMGTLTTTRKRQRSEAALEGWEVQRQSLQPENQKQLCIVVLALEASWLLLWPSLHTPETQSCMLSASRTLHSSVHRVRAVGMLDRVPTGE